MADFPPPSESDLDTAVTAEFEEAGHDSEIPARK